MISYGKVYSQEEPQEVEITGSAVFVASNITPYEEEVDGRVIHGYSYDYIQYPKDEYIQLLGDQNKLLQNDLLDTQVALCDIYESLNNGGM